MLLFKVLDAGRATVASLLRGKRQSSNTAADKAELQQWETEGGTLAPSPEATGTLVTTGSA
jgi:hypothetical protein